MMSNTPNVEERLVRCLEDDDIMFVCFDYDTILQRVHRSANHESVNTGEKSVKVE